MLIEVKDSELPSPFNKVVPLSSNLSRPTQCGGRGQHRPYLPLQEIVKGQWTTQSARYDLERKQTPWLICKLSDSLPE